MRFEKPGYLEKNRNNRRSQSFSGGTNSDFTQDEDGTGGLSGASEKKTDSPVVASTETEEGIEVSVDMLKFITRVSAKDTMALSDTAGLARAFAEIYGDTEYDATENTFLHTKENGEVVIIDKEEIVRELQACAQEYDVLNLIKNKDSDAAVIAGLEGRDEKTESNKKFTESIIPDVDTREMHNPYNLGQKTLERRQQEYERTIAKAGRITKKIHKEL